MTNVLDIQIILLTTLIEAETDNLCIFETNDSITDDSNESLSTFTL